MARALKVSWSGRGAVKGKIVYIHPRGRYYVAEGQVGGRTIREAFQIIKP